ncbi:MAG: hypothetical protein ACXVH7_07375 [Thermoanaerobaculia bacterium]
MKSSRWFLAVSFLVAVSANAARVDMADPKRAFGREDDIRIDAQILTDSIASNSPIHVVYQVENLTPNFIAVADRICAATYDAESRTIVLDIGAEVPGSASMPHLAVIAPGQKRSFSAGATPRILLPAQRSPLISVPRFVQIKVNILRDTTAFTPLIAQQTQAPQTAVPFDALLFEKWLDSNDAIYTNSIPVQWAGRSRDLVAGADQRGPGGL